MEGSGTGPSRGTVSVATCSVRSSFDPQGTRVNEVFEDVGRRSEVPDERFESGNGEQDDENDLLVRDRRVVQSRLDRL